MITDISKIDINRMRASRRMTGLSKQRTVPETSGMQMTVNTADIQVYKQDWDSLEDFRERYRRVCKFHRGDQWSDMTTNDAGETVTEETYIREQGRLPLKQNIMRPLAKSLEGLFRSEKSKSIVVSRLDNSAEQEKMLSNALQYALQVNMMREVDARTFDLFILSGMPIQKIGYDFVPKFGRYDIVIDYIDPQYIFFNSDIKDIRLNDLRRIGQIHDVTLEELYVHFAKNEADKQALRSIYGGISKWEFNVAYGLTQDRGEDLDFLTPHEQHKCRVIEVWEKKAVDIIEYWDKSDGSEGYWELGLDRLIEINNERVNLYTANGIPEEDWLLIEYDQTVGFKWFYKYLSPLGHVLRQGETPYEHGSHPFVMYPYPLINGEVWGPLEDIIDQQKYINRLITMWDFIMGTSAKNTLVVDKNSLAGQSIEDIATDWRTIGGVIALDLKNGAQMPQEYGGKMANIGITELIGMQLKWMQDISGVQPAMQGQSGNSGTPASKFAMEINQSTLNNKDIMETFQSFRTERDMKVLKTIIQYYRSKRYLAISGQSESKMYDPEKIKDSSDFDLTVGQSMDSPVYKNWIDEMLKEFVMNGMIDMEMFLNHSNLPFAQSLLEDFRNRREQLQNGSASPQEAVQGMTDAFNQKSGVNQHNLGQVLNMMNPKNTAA